MPDFIKKSYRQSVSNGNDTVTLDKSSGSDWVHLSSECNGKEVMITFRDKELLKLAYSMIKSVLDA